ncbi:hypothetical protein QBZ16_005165 [Prototheca wickerhamii]|uniref:Uncharacterized protein n=1 Tax=Prototheca wickerhamii TaxID=3111 RepID=A0AAD9MHJ9_PROWI|nr:hypothetical protein QBZ16_005165 [Prototheca wickerhamii]
MAGPKRGDGRGPRRGGPPISATTPLSKQDQAYYEEIGQQLDVIEEAEEQMLLADNAFEQARTQLMEAASEKAVSRTLEKLIPKASTEAVSETLKAFVVGDNLAAVCGGAPFPSHVVEKLLVELQTRARAGKDVQTIEQTFWAVTEAIAGNLVSVITTRHGSFVARRLLSVLAGRDLTSAPTAKEGAGGKKQREEAGEEETTAEKEAEEPPAKRRRSVAGLESKVTAGVSGGQGEEEAVVDWPELLQALLDAALADEVIPEATSLCRDIFAAPFLQSLLWACRGNDEAAGRLIAQLLGGSLLNVTPDGLQVLMQDRVASHVLEVMYQVASEDVFQKLSTAGFKGVTGAMAMHPSANFAVQAALSAVRRPPQFKRMFEDLRPSLAQLLRAHRGGVVAALVAAAHRLKAQEADVSSAVMTAAEALGAERGAPALGALLALDRPTPLAELAAATEIKIGARSALSSLGCSLAMQLLQLPGFAWQDALRALPPEQLRVLATDPAGCRVIETYLQVVDKSKKKVREMLRALEGSYGVAGQGGAGSKFVKHCFSIGDMKEKLAIAEELLKVKSALITTLSGPSLLNACHVDALAKDKKTWSQRVKASTSVRDEFKEIFE